jgi:guanylate kinase
MKNVLLCIIGKSGSGKNYIANKLGLPMIISHTTRQPRVGEKDGVDYHFVGAEDFARMEEQGLFAEFVEYNGNKYGFTKLELLKLEESDCCAIATPNGCEQLAKLFMDNIVLPVSLEADDLVRKEKLLERHKNESTYDFYLHQIEERMEQDKKTFEKASRLKNVQRYEVDYTEQRAKFIVHDLKAVLREFHEREELVVWVDFDDVLVDTLGGTIEIYNDENGTTLTKEDFKTWNVNSVADGFSEYFGKVDFLNIKEKNNSIHWMRELNKYLNINIATASSSETFVDKEKWLNENMPFIPFKNIHCIRDKSRLDGWAMIDDANHNLSNSICRHTFLYDMPHNQNNSKSHRIKSLQEVFNQLVSKDLGWE